MIQPMTVMDDVRLSAVLETPEGAPESCPLVILLHGLTSAMNRPHTLLAAQAMREAGFATLRFDLYGHGESGGEFHRHTLNKWISNTLAVIDHVRGWGITTCGSPAIPRAAWSPPSPGLWNGTGSGA